MDSLSPKLNKILMDVTRRHEDERMLKTVGFHLIELGKGWARAEMPFDVGLANSTGVFHAGALITLADTCAGTASFTLICDEDGEMGGKVPFTVQASSYLISNISSGVAIAESVVVHPGRTTHVVETKVMSDKGKLLMEFVNTHLIVDYGPRSQ